MFTELQRLVNNDKRDFLSYKDFDWSNATDVDLLCFGKGFTQEGIAVTERGAFLDALKYMGTKKFTYLETGLCEGSSVKTALGWALKNNGADISSMELKLLPKFEEMMTKIGLVDKVTILKGDSQKLPWDKKIDFLFLDSEHALSNVLGEYMKFRLYLKEGTGIVGFHDASLRGVKLAIDIIQNIDCLELISECVDNSVYGIRFFKLKYRNLEQSKYTL